MVEADFIGPLLFMAGSLGPVLLQWVQMTSDKYRREAEEFIDRGIVVVSNVLTPEEVALARKGFHDALAVHGCISGQLLHTAQNLRCLSSTNGAGGILDMFYDNWKLKLAEHPEAFRVMSTLWKYTYSTCNEEHFQHPFGRFDHRKGYMYIDRVCFRIPDFISKQADGKNGKKSIQRSLTPHLDCCPERPFSSVKAVPKWRPIQAFIALTDCELQNFGGLEACPGFHKQFDIWAANRKRNDNQCSLCVGDFTAIRPVEDKEVIQQFRHIACKAGDMVCWDYRIPHANARRNDGFAAREVVYVGFLPAIDMNRLYAEKQLKDLRSGILPSDQWHDSNRREHCDYEFSELGRKLVGLDYW